jgi:hypothetical protein
MAGVDLQRHDDPDAGASAGTHCCTSWKRGVRRTDDRFKSLARLRGETGGWQPRVVCARCNSLSRVTASRNRLCRRSPRDKRIHPPLPFSSSRRSPVTRVSSTTSPGTSRTSAPGPASSRSVNRRPPCSHSPDPYLNEAQSTPSGLSVRPKRRNTAGSSAIGTCRRPAQARMPSEWPSRSISRKRSNRAHPGSFARPSGHTSETSFSCTLVSSSLHLHRDPRSPLEGHPPREPHMTDAETRVQPGRGCCDGPYRIPERDVAPGRARGDAITAFRTREEGPPD